MSEISSLDTCTQAKLCREIIRCVNYAAIKHRDMRREDEQQSPYINHLIGVTYILVNEGGVSDISVLQAAMLHGTMEDASTSVYELHAEFGEDVANLVKELTYNKSVTESERRQLLVESLPLISHKAKLVLLAKQLNILRELRRKTPVGWSKEKVHEHFEWVSKLVSGMRKTNIALEASLDMLFKERGICSSP